MLMSVCLACARVANAAETWWRGEIRGYSGCLMRVEKFASDCGLRLRGELLGFGEDCVMLG